MGEDDDIDFRKSVGPIRRIKQDRVSPHRKRRRPLPAQTRRDEQEVIASLLSDSDDIPDVETGEELLFARPGLQHSVMRKLRRGQYVIESELDLHGHTVAEAREALSHFFADACTLRKRCVRVIHGKGNSSAGKLPILKGKVNNWLRQKKEVLAFCSARRNDGGTGAVYVLLRQKR